MRVWYLLAVAPYPMYYSLYTPMKNMVQTTEVEIQLSDSMRYFRSTSLAPGRAHR